MNLRECATYRCISAQSQWLYMSSRVGIRYIPPYSHMIYYVVHLRHDCRLYTLQDIQDMTDVRARPRAAEGSVVVVGLWCRCSFC